MTLAKRKITHLVNQLSFDGTSKVVLDLCLLFKDDYDVTVVSLTPNIELTKTKEWPDGVEVFPFNYNYDKDYSLRRYLTLYLTHYITFNKSRDIIKMVERISPDVLHVHLQPRELTIGILIKKTTNCVLLFTDHLVRINRADSTYLKRKILAYVYRGLYKHYNVIAVSEEVNRCQKSYNLLNKYNINDLIENKVDTTRFDAQTTQTNDKKIIIYVARLTKVKGHDILIHAWHKLDKNLNVNLYFVGDGELSHELKDLTEQLNLNDSIRFLGNIENIQTILQRADIAVFPSYREGLPLALLEKMACGLPVLASDIPELKRLIKNNINGLLFEAGNSIDLKNKLELLILDDALRARLGKNARNFVVAKYDRKLLKNEYSGIYSKIMKKKDIDIK